MSGVYKRTWRLSIQIRNVLKTFQEITGEDTSLKIDFNVKTAAGGIFTEGNITISGLPTADMAFLSTNFNPQTGYVRGSRVTLEVGYNGNLTKILSGNIIQAEPNFQSPNQELSLKVNSGAFNNLNTRVSDSYANGATLKSVAEKVAKNNEVVLEFGKGVANPQLRDYSFKGTPFQQIENLRKYTGADITLENEKLSIIAKDEGVGRKIKLDETSGLIGTPKPTYTGAEVTCLLNPALRVGQYIALKSKKIPQINGDYRVIELTHKGSNRGKTWESAIVATNRKWAY